jgi:acetyl-CoA synthetase
MSSRKPPSVAPMIESVLQETRLFPPPPDLAHRLGRLHIASMDQYQALHRRSIDDPEGFWGEIAREFHWFRPWDRVLDWKLPDAKWFVGGKTNLCHNCIDRHVAAGHGDEVALIWEGEPTGNADTPQRLNADTQASSPTPEAFPEIRRLTYNDLLSEVSRFATILKSLGVRKGDVVTIYLGMVPELAIAMLACARIGAAHSVIFGGFSAQAIVDRVTDAHSRIVITADAAWRRGKLVQLKENVDAACAQTDLVGNVVVVKRCGNDVGMQCGRDHWWHDLAAAVSTPGGGNDCCPCEPMDSEDMLFMLYTSGSTGKPKGIVHTTGGYMVFTALTAKYVFNLVPDRGQVFWCTADCGWVTGHSYIVYGIMANRVPTLMYEGAPNFPAEDRFWDIIARHKVSQFYTAPTAIRAFMKWGDQHPRKHDLSSLRVLGTVGEPINPEAWMWYHTTIGGGRCPIVDTWWQTETGGHMITPLPGVTPTTPGSCTLPFFGVDAAVVNDTGQEQPPNVGGMLVIRKPWPGMLRGVHGDRQRYIDTYWSRVGSSMPSGETHDAERRGTGGRGAGPLPGAYYFAGDGARRDERGYFWIMGRIDDVINVAGHRLGTMEVESALVSHDAVVEAAVVGMPDELKGTGIAAFVTLDPGHKPSEKLKDALKAHVAKEIGAIARPDMIRFTDALPKTRSGKIMRRLLRDVASGADNQQDTTTLEDFSVLAKLRENEES